MEVGGNFSDELVIAIRFGDGRVDLMADYVDGRLEELHLLF